MKRHVVDFSVLVIIMMVLAFIAGGDMKPYASTRRQGFYFGGLCSANFDLELTAVYV